MKYFQKKSAILDSENPPKKSLPDRPIPRRNPGTSAARGRWTLAPAAGSTAQT